MDLLGIFGFDQEEDEFFECEEDVHDDKTRRRQIFLLSENC